MSIRTCSAAVSMPSMRSTAPAAIRNSSKTCAGACSPSAGACCVVRSWRPAASATNRYSMTVDFAPTPVEQTLYEGVTDFLRQPDLESIDPKVRPLMLLVIHKILASSTWAVAGTLGGMVERLRDQAGTGLDDLAEDYKNRAGTGRRGGQRYPRRWRPRCCRSTRRCRSCAPDR
ncbi:hypothetical protein [Plasticicumulans sp.]|uniref:hypothetical protein n=1 Tax=Plasticicumulans sp. TaxID=2307179 RepID=UPI0039453400